MQRPRRQAAVEAIAKIRQVREWETMSESSKRFREAADQIEAEFNTEEKNQHVYTADLDTDDACTSDEELHDENSSDMQSFIEDDLVSNDTDYDPETEFYSVELDTEEVGKNEESDEHVQEVLGHAHDDEELKEL